MNSNSNTSGSTAGNGNGGGGSNHQPPHSNGNGTSSSSRKETFEDLWKDLVNDSYSEEFRTREKLTTQEQAFVREGDFKSSEYTSTRTSASIQRNTRIVNSLGYNYDTMHELFRRDICKKMHLISVSKSSGDTQVAEELAGKLIKNMEKRDINGFLRKKK